MSINTEKLDYKDLMKSQDLNKLKTAVSDDKIIEYDYKIVSFVIGNEYYGIDIMCVKEILKENKFTLVPNTLKFVTGVYNLRGEIIPIIDLAVMFNLKKGIIDKKDKNLKSIIVIRVDNLLIGLIVDKIQRVIPLQKNDIQPPSPLLGTINERYIKGVAEIDNKLYVIFDTDEIFSAKEKIKRDVLPAVSELSEEFFLHFCNQIEELADIHINEFNKQKFLSLYGEYARSNKVTDLPVLNKEIATDIVSKFYSKDTGKLWIQPNVDHFTEAVFKELRKICTEEVRVLDIGCGHGHEAFSLFFIIDKYFNEIDIKMVAADMNLSSISNASGFEIGKNELPSWINKDKYFMKLDENNYKIKKEINNKIYFEFHDARNINSYNREFDIIVARDLSLDLTDELYKKFLDDISNKMISGGLLVIGDNEVINKHDAFTRIVNKYINLYIKK